MPPPKDPVKLAEYKAKMSRIAKERGFGRPPGCEGRKLSPEEIEKLRQANLGKTISPEHRERLAEARKQELASGKALFGGVEGRTKARATTAAQRKGRSYAEIYGDRAEEQATVRKMSNRRRWEGLDRSPQREKHNSDYRYTEWRTAVFERDDYTCRRCGKRGGTLHAHHIKRWSEYPEERYVVDNGLTLCADPCHKDEHR